MKTTRCVYNDGNGADEFDTEKQVYFLTDKCNALARRLQQVETQLLKERADGKKLLQEATASSSQSVESSNNSSSRSYSCESAPLEQQTHPGAPSSDLRRSPRNSGGSSRSSSQAPRSSTADFDNRGGSGIGELNNMGTGVEKKAGAYLTPRTAGSSSSNNIHSRVHLSPEKGYAQVHQQRPHSSGVLSGVMMPPDAVKAIRDAKKPRRSGGGKMDAEALHCEVVEKEIANRFDVVTDGIEKLENVFSGAAQIMEHRVRAITTISR